MQNTAHPGIREFAVAEANEGPYSIAAGPDDALWLTFAHSGEVARLALDGQLSRYSAGPESCRPTVITRGPDELWFARTDGHIAEYDLPTPGSEPHGIAIGPDGAAWAALEIGSAARITHDR
ncbi:hypothetical protein F1721_10155 [Saccharopolyspora hirsuta]|uniref:Virginiamycin B lyase n=1 Tax=Saccharopolyspora hirsuta TaxID=1837 RepID=A0A5M7BY32_SACHI|nr:hypothetical protein [Saccharopolyspora hirsuta]KAA5835146.1 hypothetical protein F1721_10155 [Saccharopolyspora hirsuta]